MQAAGAGEAAGKIHLILEDMTSASNYVATAESGLALPDAPFKDQQIFPRPPRGASTAAGGGPS